MELHPPLRAAFASLLALALACQGSIGEPTGEPAPYGPGGPGDAPLADPEDLRFPARVWRLSPLHYQGELDRLFGEDAPEVALPASAAEKGLSDIAANARVDLGNASAFREAARQVGDWAATNAAALTGCAPPDDAACVHAYLADLASSAYRRPASDDELAALQGLYDTLRADYEFAYAFGGAVRAVLLSPGFLYRTELGDRVRDGRTELTDHEIASLLAFAITDRGPDAALLEAAAEGRLRDADERERQARRLMEGSAPMWQRFFWEWLHMATLESQGAEIDLDPALVAQMEEEYRTFVANVVVERRGTLRELFSDPTTWARPELAAHYGASHPGEGLAEIALDPAQRGGLLTQGAWLVSHGKRGRANVVRRGMGVFVDAMCNDIAPPPDLDLEAELDRLAGPDATVRDIVEARGRDGVCGNCHRVADPIGLAFESYASSGAWQVEYAHDGAPVESAIELEGLGEFDSAPALSAALADDLRFQHCFVRRLTHFMVGRDVGGPTDLTWTHEAHAAFLESGTSFEELLVALVRHPAFIERSKE